MAASFSQDAIKSETINVKITQRNGRYLVRATKLKEHLLMIALRCRVDGTRKERFAFGWQNHELAEPRVAPHIRYT